MLSTVPAFSFAEPVMVNQFLEFQTGFTPTDLEWIQSFFEPVVPSLYSGESNTGSVRFNTGLQNIKSGSDKSNSGSDDATCLFRFPNSCSDEFKTNSVKVNSDFQNIKSGSDESYTGSIKSISGSDDSTCHLSLPNSSSHEFKTNFIKIKTGYQNIKPGSDESCTGSHNSGYFTGVTSPQSVELNSESSKFVKTGSNSCNNRKVLNRPVMKLTDEKKRKRMESNRESAKRSRMRKQKQIEDLREEVNRIGLENREISNRLRILLYQIEQVSRVNHQLLSEQEILRRKLSEMRQILILRELQIQQQW